MNTYELKMMLIDLECIQRLTRGWKDDTYGNKDTVNDLRFGYLVNDLNSVIATIKTAIAKD